MKRLRFIADLNPQVSGLGKSDAGRAISFIPLESVWPDERFDPSRTVEFGGDVQSYNPVAEGDLLVPKVSPTFAHGRSTIARGLVGDRALATSEVFVLRTRDPDAAPFLKYRLLARDFLSEGQAAWYGVAGLKRISADFLLDVRINDEAWRNRGAIADFLDRECARIRELTRELEGLAAALRQQERDHFARLVRPNASVIPLRYLLTSVDQGWSPECEAREAEEGEWGVLKVGCVNRNRFSPMEHKRLPDGLEPRLRAEIRVGELLMSRANTRELVGSAAVVTTTAGRRLMLSDKLYRLRFNAAVLPQYVALALCDQRARDQIEIATAGASSSMQNISQDLVRGLRIPMAALDEQRRVVATLEAHHHRLSQSQDEVLHLMRSLADYRDALITEAVTGELDVSQLSDAQMDESTQAAFEGERPEVLSG